MRVLKVIEVGEIRVEVKELKVSEIRAWLASKTQPGDIVDETLFEDFSLSDLEVMTDLTAAAIDGLLPSEIDQVAAVVRELNARFFAMRGRVVALGQRLLATQNEP